MTRPPKKRGKRSLSPRSLDVILRESDDEVESQDTPQHSDQEQEDLADGPPERSSASVYTSQAETLAMDSTQPGLSDLGPQIDDETALGNPWKAAMITRIRTIDHLEPVDDFSAQDILDLRRAADYFSVFCYNREAFELYTIVLKRHLSDPATRDLRDDRFWYLIIQCAHNAAAVEHCEIIQAILQAQLDQLRPSNRLWSLSSGSLSPSPIHCFVYRMLIAFVSSQKGARPDIRKHLDAARALFADHDIKTFMELLSPNDRSLDLVLYHNLRRIQVEVGECDLLVMKPLTSLQIDTGSGTPQSFQRPQVSSLEELILFRVPGPFEVQQDLSASNPCVRSCFTWCANQLKLNLFIVPLPPSTESCYQESEVAMDWVKSNAFFRAVWQLWRQVPNREVDPWMMHTRPRMGISASELLFLVCQAIYHQYLSLRAGRRPTRGSWLSHLRNAAVICTQKSDLELASSVLDQYVARNTMTDMPGWQYSARQLERKYDAGCLAQALRVSFPNLGVASGVEVLVNSMLLRPLSDISRPRSSFGDDFDTSSIVATRLSQTRDAPRGRPATATARRTDIGGVAALVRPLVLSTDRLQGGQEKPQPASAGQDIINTFGRSLVGADRYHVSTGGAG
ncbi:hypothetical protein B0H63DRAFT_558357 [Podospora didyma]|uniref:Uncharacterized protein n=1 Tax=Podospora didyma TaxID=330526 RepID=A0AAE0U144_9PEZI|nr:hypothetical protein B0H63DRAFT_558357 [Podospora didyma]